MGKTRNGIGFGYRTGMASKGSKLNYDPAKDEALTFWAKSRSGLSLIDEKGHNASILPAVLTMPKQQESGKANSGVLAVANTVWAFKANIKMKVSGEYAAIGGSGFNLYREATPNGRWAFSWGDTTGYSTYGADLVESWRLFIIYDKRLWVVPATTPMTDASILNVIATVTPTVNNAAATWIDVTVNLHYFANPGTFKYTVLGEYANSYIGTITGGVITWQVKHVFVNTKYCYDLLDGSKSVAMVAGGTHSVSYSQYGDDTPLNNGIMVYQLSGSPLIKVPYANSAPYTANVPSGYVKILDIPGSTGYHNLADSLIRFPLGSVWDRSNATIYKDAARLGYYNAANPTDWHITELNQLAMNELWFNTDQDIVFVKMASNSVDVEDRVKLLELLSYSAPKTGDDLIKVLKYTGDYPYFL